MSRSVFRSVFLLALAALSVCFASAVENHRATRLGNPATRFAPPLSTPEDLRSRFRDERLRPDFEAVLQQWAWTGKMDDLFEAAANADIQDVAIPIGSTMPFMSSRENGRAICLKNVLWAGEKPAPAFAFHFSSEGRRYRCVTPKACSNFFLEDLGPEPKSALSIDCTAPTEVLAGRPAQVCMVVRNTGNNTEPKAVVKLPLPTGSTAIRASQGHALGNGQLTWELSDVAAGRAFELCASFVSEVPGVLSFTPTASSATVTEVSSACETKVTGMPAILIDAIDLEDPNEVGKEVVYEIKVTNQGTVPGTRVKLICTLPECQEYVSGSGPTTVTCEGRTVTTDPLPSLDPKAVATWRVVVKALKAADTRFLVDLSSDQFELPIHEEESTLQY